MSRNLTTHSANRIYDRNADVYDRVFEPLFAARIHEAIRRLRLPSGARVLDIGVGTGLSLHAYTAGVEVYGLDLSARMLAKAQQRLQQTPPAATVHLIRCDALRPPFADASFDAVVMAHVVSVVEHPAELIRVARRLGKPNCPIVIVNHFQSSRRLVAIVERWLNPLCHQLGWRSDLTLRELVDDGGLVIDFQYKLAWWDPWRIIFGINAPEPTRTTQIARPGEAFSAVLPTCAAG